VLHESTILNLLPETTIEVQNYIIFTALENITKNTQKHKEKKRLSGYRSAIHLL